MHRFRRVQEIPRPLEEVFAFFADVRHLAAIAPPFLDLGWVTDPDRPIEAGSLIDYRVRLHGIPFPWRTRILAFEPPYALAYEQARGPCRRWRHDYRFEATPGGTVLIDDVAYDPGWGLPGRIAHHLVFRRTVQVMFDHRARCIDHLLGPGEGA